MKYNRRHLLTLASAAVLSSCGYTPKQRRAFLDNCSSLSRLDDILRIDMHCHLMSSQDSNESAFINRRIRKADPKDRSANQAIGRIARYLRRILVADYRTARTEANNLRNIGVSNLERFCTTGLPRDFDLFVSNDGSHEHPHNIIGDGRLLGFLTSRTRNAAMIMAQFPLTDLFIPSIVDFYESSPESYSDPARQMQFYSALSIATDGRFLPMVSFNPERYYYERRDKHALTNLDLVEGSILNAGAVGVKVHPSSGFDPFSNVDFAFLSGADSGQSTDDDPHGCDAYRAENRQKLQIMDDGMKRLYEICHKYDVPILTHSGLSISSNAQCMERDENPDSWTNSTYHWAQALAAAQKRGHSRARVVFAHFAGGFAKMEAAKSRDRDSPSQFPVEGASQLTPGKWLETALRFMRSSRRKDMFLDTSIMNELALSQAYLENKESVGQAPWTIVPSKNPIAQRAFKEAEEDCGNMAKLFRQFILDHPELDSRTMFGTDWHMPNASAISGGDAFQRLLENAFRAKPRLREKVMGENAAKFFGLRKSEQNRTRVEKFLHTAGVDLKNVRWMRKLDEQM